MAMKRLSMHGTGKIRDQDDIRLNRAIQKGSFSDRDKIHEKG